MDQSLQYKIYKYVCRVTIVINLIQICINMVVFGTILSAIMKKLFKIDFLQKYYPFCINLLLYVNGFNIVYEMPLEVDTLNEQYVFMCSHASMLDPIAVYRTVEQILVTISKDTLFKVPLFKHAISYWGAVPIKREDLKSAIQTYDNAREVGQKRKLSFLIFPEGQRRRKDSGEDFNIQPLKKGPFHLAKQMKKDIVVVNIVGARRLLNGITYTPGNLFVKYSKPIKYNDIKDMSITEMQDKVHETFKQNFFTKSDKEVYQVTYDRWLMYFTFWLFYQYCIYRTFMGVLSFVFQLFQILINLQIFKQPRNQKTGVYLKIFMYFTYFKLIIQMKLIKLIFVTFLTHGILNDDKNRCILNKLISWVKKESLQEVGKNNDANDPIIKLMEAGGNINQMELVQQMIMNFSLLPLHIQTDMKNCPSQEQKLMEKCEQFHGENNCESYNAFTVVQKCPEGYIRDDITRCKRTCDDKREVVNDLNTFQEAQFSSRSVIQDDNEQRSLDGENNTKFLRKKLYVIDYNCYKFKTKTLNKGLLFNSLIECQYRFQICQKIGDKLYQEACPINFKQIGFLCVPYCFSELPDERVRQMKQQEDYCYLDYVTTGMPFFDLQLIQIIYIMLQCLSFFKLLMYLSCYLSYLAIFFSFKFFNFLCKFSVSLIY